jgi:CheY-like chemotaxis protein
MLKLFKSKKRLDRPRILVVDDEPDFLSTVQCQLRWCNYEVITASNGAEGLEKATKEKPDVILLDINMPTMNGKEALRNLKSDPQLRNIPVIMLTALCDADDIAAVSAYGISDYVTKPFDFSELTDKITHALEKRP